MVKSSLKGNVKSSKQNAKRVNFPIICDNDGYVMQAHAKGTKLVEIREFVIFDYDNYRLRVKFDDDEDEGPPENFSVDDLWYVCDLWYEPVRKPDKNP